jgi:hypothetical protein
MADRYDIQYTNEAVEDIQPLRAFDRQRILDGIEQHLGFEPTRLSRSPDQASKSAFLEPVPAAH